MKPRTMILAGAVAVFLTVGAGMAGVIVEANPSPPTADILTYYSVGYDNFAWGCQWIGDSGGDHRDVAQSFLVTGPNDWSVGRITVKVREFGTSVVNQGFHLDIWTVSDASDWSGDSLVSTQSDIFPSSGLTAGYWTFDLDDVTLSSGEYYAFVLGFESGTAPQRFVNLVNAYSANDLYLDGRMFGRSGTPLNWTTLGASSNRDFDFYVQGAAVPEPASLSLLALAVGGMLPRRRRGPRNDRAGRGHQG